jgi:predicted XRE-type DNA-binding protein
MSDSAELRAASQTFCDLGFEKGEAQALAVKAHLLIAFHAAARLRCTTQAALSNLLGVTQPRVNSLLRGRLDLVSIDTLIEVLVKLEAVVAVEVFPAISRWAVAPEERRLRPPG